jgi:hypothetical protein
VKLLPGIHGVVPPVTLYPVAPGCKFEIPKIIPRNQHTDWLVFDFRHRRRRHAVNRIYEFLFHLPASSNTGAKVSRNS